MATRLPIIVDRLNKAPFNKELSLVAFHEYSPTELLQVLNDVVAHLDSTHAAFNVRGESRDATATRMSEFLSNVNFPFPKSDAEAFKNELKTASANAVYHALAWLLEDLERLQTKAFLARYLAPVRIPSEFASDPMIDGQMGPHGQLRREFIAVHKKLEALKKDHLPPATLNREITTMTSERQQLRDRIALEEKRTRDQKGFDEMLRVTSMLRTEQEEEQRNMERKDEQGHRLRRAEMDYVTTMRKLNELQSRNDDHLDPEQLLSRLEEEVAEMRMMCREKLPLQLESRKERMHALRQVLMAPLKTEDDVMIENERVMELQRSVDRLSEQVQRAQRGQTDQRLALFRQQAALVAKKLQDNEEKLEEAKANCRELQNKVSDKAALLAELTGPKVMQREEFQAFALKLRKKKGQFVTCKQELSKLQARAVVAARTEQIIKGRDRNAAEVVQQVDALQEAGGGGYNTTQHEIEKAAQDTRDSDEMKGKTLEQISQLSIDINAQLKARHSQLQPKVARLREVRKEYKAHESECVWCCVLLKAVPALAAPLPPPPAQQSTHALTLLSPPPRVLPLQVPARKGAILPHGGGPQIQGDAAREAVQRGAGECAAVGGGVPRAARAHRAAQNAPLARRGGGALPLHLRRAHDGREIVPRAVRAEEARRVGTEARADEAEPREERFAVAGRRATALLP